MDDFQMISDWHRILRMVGMLVLLGVGFGFAARTVYWLLAYIAWGKGKLTVNRLGERVRGFATYVIGQRKVINEPSGMVHLFIFWGFIVLQLETLEYFARGFLWGFHLSKIVGEPIYNLMLFSQDIAGAIVAVAIVIATIRRFIIRPKHVVISRDALVINGFILGLMVTKFLANGAEILLLPPSELGHNPSWTPFALMTSHLLQGLSAQMLATIYHVCYWTHVGIVVAFANYVPLGKHLHLIGAMPNVFFRKLEPRGALFPIDLEDDTIESYGVGKVEELTWKQLLDTYACTECGRCEHYCPAYNTGKALNPMMIVHKVKDQLKEKGERLIRNKETDIDLPKLTGGVITAEELWACTTCGACVGNCPVFIEHVDTIVDMRRHIALMEADYSPEISRTFKNMENSSNPWGISGSYRADWAEGLDIPLLSELVTPPEYLFWVGCAGAFDDRQKKVTNSFAKILKAAGVSFAILGTEEGCTGDPARRIGNEYLYWMLATQNIEVLNSYKVRKIITTCPHCFHTIGKEYPQLGGDYEVIHHTHFLDYLLKENMIKLKPSAAMKITYHDSCYIGRWCDEYDSPRNILNAVPGVEVQEMELNKLQSFCCGAGGGRMWMEEHEGKRVNIERTDQALATDPDAIAVACPFCMTMFDDGLKNRGAKVPLKDLAEIVEANMAAQPVAPEDVLEEIAAE